jgi:hypothetical protein
MPEAQFSSSANLGLSAHLCQLPVLPNHPNSCEKFSNRESMSLSVETYDLILGTARQFVPIVSDATVVPASGGFSGAGVWQIESQGRKYALRRWPSFAPEPARLRGLHRLLRHVWNWGLDVVAVPCETPESQSLLWIGGHWWQLEPWRPGLADFHFNPNPVRLCAAMQRLAHWQHAVQTFVPLAVEKPWFESYRGTPPGLHERLVRFNSCLNNLTIAIPRGLRESSSPQVAMHAEVLHEILQLVVKTLPNVRLRLTAVANQQCDLRPCLRDLWHDHLLFTGDEVTGLIDPSACRTDHVAADLSRLIGSLVGNDRALWQTALDEFHKRFPIELHEWKLVEAYDQSGVVLAGLVWLEWLILEQRLFPDQHLVSERLAFILRRLRGLAFE